MVNDRIEQVLAVWERNCLSTKIAVKMISLRTGKPASALWAGPTIHSESFRTDVLSRKPFEAHKYHPSNPEHEDVMGAFSYLPGSIHSWATASRRIYSVDQDIQRLILQTNVSELTWNDIVFPFPAFGIALADPINEPNGQWFDFLLIHRGMIQPLGREGIMVWMFSRDYEKPIGVTKEKFKQAYDKMIFRNDFKKANELNALTASQGFISNTAFSAKLNCMMVDSEHFDMPIKDMFAYIEKHEGEKIPTEFVINHALTYSQMNIEVERIVAGLCVYLDTHRNSPTRKARTDWKPLEHPTLDPTRVTNEAEICKVQNVYEISELERELLLIIDPIERDRRCKELGAHYREGHARRRPGCGDDPDAPRCVHVRPAIVGLRRLGPNSLPRGTEKQL